MLERRAERRRQLGRRLRPVARVLRQHLQHQCLQRQGDLRRQFSGRPRIGIGVLTHHHRWQVAGERRTAGEHLVEHAAERVDVRPLVGLTAERRLGRDVWR
jgi:hypothetical protein